MVNSARTALRKFKRLFILSVCLAYSFTAYAETVPEYTLKAIFLYNFINFVTWPVYLSEYGHTKKICVIGTNPFGNDLQELVNENKQDNLVSVHYIKKINNIKGCHILFVSRSEQNRVKVIINHLENQPVLTISDIQNFASNSGMIEFAVKSNKVKLLLNLEAVKNGHIKIDSDLIELSTIVQASNNKEERE